jgi:hypothetical protein
MYGWLARLARPQPLLGNPWPRRAWEGLSVLWKVVISFGAFAGAILAIVGLIALVDSGDGPPPSLDGQITEIELAQRQTLGDYCRVTYTGERLEECLAQPYQDELGFVFYVRIALKGHTGPCCFLHYTLVDSSLQPIPGFVRVHAVENVTPEGVDDAGGWRVWVGNPSVRTFDARFDLDKTSGGNLDSGSTSVSV